MPMFEPRHLLLRCLLLGLPGLACQETVAPVEADAGTTGVSTTPESPTTTTDTPTTADNEVPTTTTTTTSTSSTSEDAGSSSSEAGTTGASWCGDGVVSADEACDDGLAGNDDSRFCTANCMLNVCGDGKLFVGWELCDEGAANSDEYGSLCGSQCEPGPRCGDHKLQAEFETCDLGLGNGGAKGDEQGILCDASCRAERLRGFVTETAFSGALGGLFGADLKCRAAAKAAGLAEPERFYAFLSTGDIHAKQRFEKVATSWPYVLVTGKKFADSFAALIETGPLGEGLLVTEHGHALYKANVATNTQPGGISFNADQHCQAWTSAEDIYKARLGLTAVTVDSPDKTAWKDELWWTGFLDRPCNKTLFHLYCLEI